MKIHAKTVPVLFWQSMLSGAAGAALALIPVETEAKVGVAAAVNVDARGQQPGANARIITLGSDVIFNEEITTDGKGLVQLLLLDGTTFTIGPNAHLIIDEFVYKPETGEARVVATLAKGAFRFIGGQASRRAGGVTINTAAGAIGVRGAMVEGNVRSASDATFSMIFGREVLFTGQGGSRSRLYKPGYTMVVSGVRGRETTVRPRTTEDAASFQAALAGRSGTSGGASTSPDDKTVAQSGLAEVNSGLPDKMMIPPDRPAAVQSASLDNVEEAVVELDQVAQLDLLRSAIASITVQPAIPEPGPGPAQPAIPEPGPGPSQPSRNPTPPSVPGGPILPTGPLKSARVLTAPDVYESLIQRPVRRAGQRGLVGTTPETDRALQFGKAGDRLVSADGAINLPDLTGAPGDRGLQRVDVIDGLSPQGTLAGPAYAGVGDFSAYFLGIGGDPKKPHYVLYGTPTPTATMESMFKGSQLHEYTLTMDPLRPSAVPFFFGDLYGPVTNFSSTNLLVVESDTDAFHREGANFDTKVFQSWVDIQGQGMNQKSAAGLYVSAVVRGGEDVYRIASGTRRGSFRYAATAGPANMRGALGTLAAGDGSQFFGADANHFVLAAPPGDPFSDSLLGPGFTGREEDDYLQMGGPFSTYHVADLVGGTELTDLERTSRQVSGFMSGLGESSQEGLNNPYALTSPGAPNFLLNVIPIANAVTSGGVVYDALDQSAVVANYLITLGPNSTGGAGNAFVDNDRFGAQFNGNGQNTRLRTDGGQNLAQRAGVNPGSYLISGRANPIPGFQHCTSCEFLDWGWWGTRVDVAASGSEVPSGRSDYVHLGTWVAGDIARPVDLPNNISVNYAGTALGNVARQTSDGVGKYIASGGMNMSFDFASRTGNLHITDFDGMNLSSAVSESSTATQALFSGPLGGAGLAGSVHGAFVNNGPDVAAGIIGDFAVSGAGVRAAGTIAGARVP
jgi:hypothetical protein